MLAMNISEYSQCAVCRQNNEKTRVKWIENLTFSILFFYCLFKLGMPVSAVELLTSNKYQRSSFFFFPLSICCCASCKKTIILTYFLLKSSGKRSVNSYTKVCSMWLSLLVYYRRIIIVKNVRSTVPLNIDYKSKIFTDEKWQST